jgi:hypothetical protein
VRLKRDDNRVPSIKRIEIIVVGSFWLTLRSSDAFASFSGELLVPAAADVDVVETSGAGLQLF